ncbi:MAG: glycosyltransferase [Burkholderiaceae bacterium]
MTDPIRVFVGTDRSQYLAVKVLEHSIKRHTDAQVEVTAMLDLPVPEPRDPRNGQRTGFSYSRFCIPKLAGYRGRAIYMDADMLVFRDIRELWSIPFDDAKVIIQREIKHNDETTRKFGAPRERIKQCAVMVLDCENLDWNIERIVADMDADRYDYAGLMYHMCILPESEIKYGVPFEWNSLEHYDSETRLIHYTDMATQPWVSPFNRLGYLWFNEVRDMLRDGSLTQTEIDKEIELGYFRPSLVRDIQYRHLVPRLLWPLFDARNAAYDKLKGYKPHKAVYEAKKIRDRAIKAFESKKAAMSGAA